MRFWRRAAWLLLGAGIALGTGLDDSSARTPPRLADGSFVLSADFHVHAFPGDGALPVSELRKEARRRRLDVLAITNHNQTLAARIGRWLAPATGVPLVLVGDEITAPRYHLVAAGIERPIDWRLSAAEAIEAVHAQGGIAIAAHPVRQGSSGFDDEAMARLDGAEVAHPLVHSSAEGRRELVAFHERANRLRANVSARGIEPLQPHVAPIGSSDFHMIAPLGFCRTDVVASAFTEKAVLEAVRAGRTIAYDPSGNAYGDPELVRLVRGARPAPAPEPVKGLARVANVLAWLGLLGLVVFDRERSIETAGQTP